MANLRELYPEHPTELLVRQHPARSPHVRRAPPPGRAGRPARRHVEPDDLREGRDWPGTTTTLTLPVSSRDHTAEDVALELMIADIRAAADVLRPVFDASDGADGFVSLEMSPALAHDTAGAVAMAHRLSRALDRPNAMIKIAGTPEGVIATEECLAAGLNINITLLFSIADYEASPSPTCEALERRARRSLPGLAPRWRASSSAGSTPRSTARCPQDSPFRGKAGIANAKLAYARFRSIFSGPRWEALAARGAPTSSARSGRAPAPRIRATPGPCTSTR